MRLDNIVNRFGRVVGTEAPLVCDRLNVDETCTLSDAVFRSTSNASNTVMVVSVRPSLHTSSKPTVGDRCHLRSAMTILIVHDLATRAPWREISAC